MVWHLMYIHFININLSFFICGLDRLDCISLYHKVRLTFIRNGPCSANQSVKFFTRQFTLGHASLSFSSQYCQ